MLSLPLRAHAARLLRVSVYVCLGFASVYGLRHSRTEVNAREAYERGMARVRVKPPQGAPIPSQEHLELALALYGIAVPPTADSPRYDADLRDRGLTTRGTFLSKAEVTIGPAAFASWSLLGSTLAHELEVHCRQNFLLITLMDSVGFDGTGEAERQAYAHELRHAHRFGLDIKDAELIADTVEYYYPEGGASTGRLEMPRTIKRWLARNLLEPTRL